MQQNTCSGQDRFPDSLLVPEIDARIEVADKELWAAFEQWMGGHETPWLKWHLHEHLNNHAGILLFCISRNHRGSPVWEMLRWITDHGPGSYGLFYVHDDEDIVDASRFGRGITTDYNNLFRVHRILNEALTELDDPFFGPITPNIDPPHPYDRDIEEAD